MKISRMCQPSGSVFSFSWLALIFIFTLACDKSNISPDENLGEELTKQAAMHQVSQDLYRVIAEDQGAQNFAISPVSIQLALYMVYNGSEGETREEIGQMLQVMDADLEALNQRVKQVQDYLTGLIDEGYLDIHNALFYDENRVELAEAFVDRLSSYYDIHKDNLNFDDPAAVEAINAWVKDKTYDKIEQVLQDISEEEVLFLINA